MNRRACPNHKGIFIENHPCPRCAQPEVATNEPTFEEAPVTNPLSAVPDTGGNGGSSTSVMEREHYDRVTVPVQPTLSDEIFKPLTRKRKPPMKLSLSGNETLTMTAFDSLVYDADGEASGPKLAEGMIVDLAGYGYISAIGQAFTPKGETILTVAMKLLSYQSVRLTGALYDPEAEDE